MIVILAAIFWWLVAPHDNGTLAEIRRRGTLRVGLDASFPPFETINGQGQIIGLDVDLAEAIAADLGVKAEFVAISFDGLYDALLAHHADLIISGLPYDSHWTEDVAYTANYFNAGQALVVRPDETTIKAIPDLAGRQVAVEWGSQADMEGRRLEHEINGLTLLRHDSAAAALAALYNGTADAAIVDGVSAKTRAQKILLYLTDEWYAAAVHIESHELLAAANQTLARLEENGEMNQLQAKWLR
jgi:polar amino acid transport system substrate-binding protein